MAVQSHVVNVNKCVKKYKSKIVYATVVNNGISINWKADWAQFRGKTYAQVLKSNIDNCRRSRIQAKYKVDIPRSRERHLKFVNTDTVASVGLPVHAKNQKLMSGNMNTKITKNFQNPSSNEGFVCPTANRFALLDLNAAEQNDDCDSSVAINKNPDTNELKPINQVKVCKQSKNIGKNQSIHIACNVNQSSQKEGQNCQKPSKLCPEMPEDKYDLGLQVKSHNKDRLNQARSDPTYKKWSEQTDDKFGFIPLGPLVIPTSDKRTYLGSDPIKLYDLTRKETTFNFLSTQIQIHSQLNADAWEKLLENYWDQQLPYLIRYGFPLDFDRNSKLGQNDKNHTSALAFPQDIDAYLKEEISYGAIFGPYKHPPFDNFHTSPFMTRPKPGAAHRRVIIDLSFPHGQAVNSNISKNQYLGTEFVLTLPSIDTITNKVKRFGKGSLLYKIDISRAFRHVKIDPRDYFLLGLKHQDYYLDTCLPFGYRNGSGIFQRLSDAIRFIMKSQGYDVINYIDDVIGFGTISNAKPSFEALTKLLQKLGLDISIKKLVQPSTKVTCLGVEVDTKTLTVAIPSEKVSEILKKCHQWSHKTYATKNELQSLLGSLLYISKCVKSSRTFLNRMLDTLRRHFGTDNIVLDIEFHRDLNWFKKFLKKFNGTAFFDHRPVKATIELDACLQGLGAIYRNQVYAIPIPHYCDSFSIVHLEMLNILVAIRVWGNDWKHQRVLIKCDNQAVVSVLNSGKTQDLTLAAIARNIMMEISDQDIDLQVIHILGIENKVADLLSRWFITHNPGNILNNYVASPMWMHLSTDIAFIDWSI